MATEPDRLYVRSHTSRDLLQSAGLFKNEHLVVWEYVSNGLQYQDPGSSPIVRVRLDNAKKRITIADNGRGMKLSDLENFFLMHGENLERKQGRTGRGLFGTGKSAAFGIAGTLVVTTVRDGVRTKVSLNRQDIESMSDDSPIPVQVIEREVSSTEPSGTVIEIIDVHLRKLDQRRVIRFIERHLARWPRGVTVWVNNHECQYAQPVAVRTESVGPKGDLAEKLGNVSLVLRVASAPLSVDERGVAIFSKGVWYETTFAGSEGREMSAFIFGEIDVPRLDEDASPIAPFDMSRSMQLNPANSLVQALFAFVGIEVEQLRRKLVAEERERRASEDARRLAKQANAIAQVINEDFSDFRRRLAKVHARARGGEDLGPMESKETEDGTGLVPGNVEPAIVVSPEGGPGAVGDSGGEGHIPRNLGPELESGTERDPIQGEPTGSKSGRHRQMAGGFSIDFRQMGAAQKRAKYHRDERQIVINLDHPQLRAALGVGGIEDLAFRRLAYEVAFSEYALALALELALRDEYADIAEPIVEVAETLDRVARRAEKLYRSGP